MLNPMQQSYLAQEHQDRMLRAAARYRAVPRRRRRRPAV